jgi:hypothetical protein
MCRICVGGMRRGPDKRPSGERHESGGARHSTAAPVLTHATPRAGLRRSAHIRNLQRDPAQQLEERHELLGVASCTQRLTRGTPSTPAGTPRGATDDDVALCFR